MLTRREAVVAGAALIATPTALAAATANLRRAKFLAGIKRLERDIGGNARIGIALIDPVGGQNATYRAAERFPMCSTFKLLLVGNVLWRVDRGIERINREVAIPAVTLDHSPVTKAYADATLPVKELCGAAITQSDNTAANLLLDTLGGPAGLTKFLRATGDAVTRLDRYELSLNEGTPGDPRDTTTPQAMLDTLRRLTFGSVLRPDSRRQLLFWLANNTTGAGKLRKGLPANWAIGDKTGAGGHNSNNDIALIWPAGRAPRQPIFVASFVTGGPGDDTLARNPVHAKIGEMIAELIGGR